MAAGDQFMTGRSGGAPNGQVRVGCSVATKMIADEELLRLLLTGLTIREAAGHVRSSYGRCCRIARTPEFLLKLREHSSEIAQRMVDELSNNQIDFARKLEEASEAALDEMLAMMGELTSASTLKKQICQDLLDRDPRSSRTKRMDITGTMSHDFISPAVLIHAAATAKELEAFQTKKGALSDGNGNSDHHADSGNGQG